jgi:hypothetical protein
MQGFYRGVIGMRNALSVVALLVVAFAAAPASASTYTDASDLPPASYAAKYENYSDLYVPGGSSWVSENHGTVVGATGTGTPVPLGVSVSDLVSGIGTLEDRAIFNVTSIQNITTGTTAWNGSAQQLSGLFYNLTLTGVTVGTNSITLDFSPSTRTTPLAGSPGYAALPAGSGGTLQVYAGSSLNFNPDPNGVGVLTPSGQTAASVNGAAPVSNGQWGPGTWVEGSGSTSDSYATASAGSVWLEGAFIPLEDAGFTPANPADPTAVFEEQIDTATGVGSSTGYIDLTGGTDLANIGVGDLGFGPYVDMIIGADEYGPRLSPATGGPSADLEPDSNYVGTGYWPVDSEDPVHFGVIPTVSTPEPVSMILFGTGLVGVCGYVARRKNR